MKSAKLVVKRIYSTDKHAGNAGTQIRKFAFFVERFLKSADVVLDQLQQHTEYIHQQMKNVSTKTQ